MSFNNPFVYRENLVLSFYEKFNYLAVECNTKERFEIESLFMVNALFDEIDLESKEYHAILKIRSEFLKSLNSR